MAGRRDFTKQNRRQIVEPGGGVGRRLARKYYLAIRR
jgi:hypothetical protein